MNQLILTVLLFPLIGLLAFNSGTVYNYKSSENDSLGHQSGKEQLSTFEKSFKPSFYDTEVYLYMKSDTTKTFGRPIDDLTTAAPETLQGFRVQLLATNVYDEALAVRNDLFTRYPDMWIYNVYEVPAYKIRIGDFVSRAEAAAVLNKFHAEGFRTAWVVPDKIILNQPPKPPLPIPIDSTSIQSNGFIR